MAANNKFTLKGKNRDSYLELALAFPLSSIRSDPHLCQGQDVMDGVLARGRLDAGEETFLDAPGATAACPPVNPLSCGKSPACSISALQTRAASCPWHPTFLPRPLSVLQFSIGRSPLSR